MATQVEELRQKASSAWDEYSVEFAKYSDNNLPNQEQADHIGELRGKATAAQKQLLTAETFIKDKSDFETQSREMKTPSRPAVDVAERVSGLRVPRASIGHRFVQMPEYKEWVDTFAPNGRFPDRATLNSPPLHFGGFHDLDRHAELLQSGEAGLGGSLIIPDQYTPITEFGRRPLTIRQVITNLQTSSDTVEFVRIISETNNAAVVPEATATDPEQSGAVSGVKPESGMEFERVSTPVKTIAHWMPATTRVLSDASQLRGLIDAFLRYYLDLALEDQIVQGDGMGDNFEGILHTANVQYQDIDPGDVGTGNFFRTARIAKRKVLTVGRRRPTAFLLNPEDWEQLDLAKDGTNRFYTTGPFDAMAPRLWGLPVVETEAVPAGHGLVGDWSTCVLWDREQGSISVSNSHADFFIRNLLAILCEIRAAFGILKPDALVEFETGGLS